MEATSSRCRCSTRLLGAQVRQQRRQLVVQPVGAAVGGDAQRRGAPQAGRARRQLVVQRNHRQGRVSGLAAAEQGAAVAHRPRAHGRRRASTFGGVGSARSLARRRVGHLLCEGTTGNLAQTKSDEPASLPVSDVAGAGSQLNRPT